MTPLNVSTRNQSGVALALVVWFIAGMSLLVAGIVFSARSDVRMAQLHLARAQVTTAGDGAIDLLLADMLDGAFNEAGGGGLAQQSYRFGELQVTALAIPEPLMVDLNGATPELLSRVFSISGAVNGEDAQDLARAVVQWRTGNAGDRMRRFEALEDLLDVEGMNRKTWDSLRDYIAVSTGMAGGRGNSPRAQQALQRLQEASPQTRAGRPGLFASLSDSALTNSRSGRFRVDALVQMGESRWLRRRWVSLSNARTGLPWQFVRTEPARIVPVRRNSP